MAGRAFRDPRNGVHSASLHIPSSLNWLEEHVSRVPEQPPETPETPPTKPENPEKEKCSQRIDGILVEKTTGDCAKEKIKW